MESISMHHDLTALHPMESIWAAFATLFGGGDNMVRVTGKPPAGTDFFEIVLAEAELRDAMLIYSRNILLISLVISIITATLVYAALRAMIVRPIERLTRNILAFSEAPENEGSIIVPSGRRDEHVPVSLRRHPGPGGPRVGRRVVDGVGPGGGQHGRERDFGRVH